MGRASKFIELVLTFKNTDQRTAYKEFSNETGAILTEEGGK